MSAPSPSTHDDSAHWSGNVKQAKEIPSKEWFQLLLTQLQGSFFGEESDETRMAILSGELGDDTAFQTPWSITFRIWLLQMQQRALLIEKDPQAACEKDADTRMLNVIFAQLRIELLQHVVDMDDELAENDDLMSSFVVQETSPQKDRMLVFWENHQRFFVVQALKVMWNDCLTPEQHHMLRNIVQGIDRLMKTSARLPPWMDPRTGHCVGSGHRERIASSQSDYPQRKDDEEESDLDWLRTKVLPDEAKFCERLGHEGSQGSLCRKLFRGLHFCSTAHPFMIADLQRLFFPSTAIDAPVIEVSSIYGRRGRALLLETLKPFLPTDHRTLSSNASVDQSSLFSWKQPPPYPCSVELAVRDLLKQESVPNLVVLVDWIFDGFDEAFDQAKTLVHEIPPGDLRKEMINAFRLYSDWIPFSLLNIRFRSLLQQVLSLKPHQHEDELFLFRVSMYTEIILTWIENEEDWLPLLWESLWSGDMLSSLLHFFLPYHCLVVDYERASSILDAPTILLSCFALCEILTALEDRADCKLGLLKDSCREVSGALALFRLVHPPLVPHDTPLLVVETVRDLEHKFQQLAVRLAVESLPIELYLDSLLKFAVSHPSLECPLFCHQAIGICSSYWTSHQRQQQPCIRHIWLSKLADVTTARNGCAQMKNSNHQVGFVWALHKEASVLLFSAIACMQSSSSLVQIVLQSQSTSSSVIGPMMEPCFRLNLIRHTPPNALFCGGLALELASSLKAALDLFPLTCAPCLLLGVALRLDMDNVNDGGGHHPDDGYEDDSMMNEKKNVSLACAKIARAFLLSEIRRRKPSPGWCDSVLARVEQELMMFLQQQQQQQSQTSSSRGMMAVTWWRRVTRDLKRQTYRNDDDDAAAKSSSTTSLHNKSILLQLQRSKKRSPPEEDESLASAGNDYGSSSLAPVTAMHVRSFESNQSLLRRRPLQQQQQQQQQQQLTPLDSSAWNLKQAGDSGGGDVDQGGFRGGGPLSAAAVSSSATPPSRQRAPPSLTQEEPSASKSNHEEEEEEEDDRILLL